LKKSVWLPLVTFATIFELPLTRLATESWCRIWNYLTLWLFHLAGQMWLKHHVRERRILEKFISLKFSILKLCWLWYRIEHGRGASSSICWTTHARIVIRIEKAMREVSECTDALFQNWRISDFPRHGNCVRP
jgi:hypothetical protein